MDIGLSTGLVVARQHAAFFGIFDRRLSYVHGVPDEPTKIMARARGRSLDPARSLGHNELASEGQLIEHVTAAGGAVKFVAQKKSRLPPPVRTAVAGRWVR